MCVRYSGRHTHGNTQFQCGLWQPLISNRASRQVASGNTCVTLRSGAQETQGTPFQPCCHPTPHATPKQSPHLSSLAATWPCTLLASGRRSQVNRPFDAKLRHKHDETVGLDLRRQVAVVSGRRQRRLKVPSNRSTVYSNG